MKWFVLLLVLLLIPVVHADVIMPGTKSIEYCAKVEGTTHFPEYKFVYRVLPPGYKEMYAQDPSRIIEFVEVRENECLDLGYKFNTFDAIYAIPLEDYNPINISVSSPGVEVIDVTLNRLIRVKQTDPRETVVETFTITKHPVEGFIATKEIETGVNPWYYLYYAVSFFALIALVFLVLRKKGEGHA